MRYRAVLFDVDDTLLDFQTGNRNAVNLLMDELGYFDPMRYEQYEAINLECWAALERGELSEKRLLSYQKLRAENARSEDAKAFRTAKEKKFKQIAKFNKTNPKK